MKEKNILITLPLSESHMDRLRELVPSGSCHFVRRSPQETASSDLAEVNAVIGNLPPALLSDAPELEWVQLQSAGADPYVRAGILKPDTVLTNASGAYGLSVSEHMVAVTFALIRHLHTYILQQSRRTWAQAGPVISVERSTVLVLGTGDIGESYARKMKALGAYVIGVRRSETEKPSWLDEQHTVGSLDQLLGRADIVAMILPGGDATERIMDERRLRLMKSGSFLINDGRGNAIDMDALKKVLREGHLGGAALDVTDPEPLPAEDELWEMPNVIITPHIAGQFLLPETLERVVEIVGENLRRYTSGEKLLHVVDRSRGY